MSAVTISERRAIMASSVAQPDFRDLLKRDPRAGFEIATGRSPPQDVQLHVIEEYPGVWAFVVPGGTIDATLPEPGDARGVIENDVYAILRDEPGLRDRAVRQPKRFVAERLGIDLGASRVDVHVETPGNIMLVVPDAEGRDELSDAALDMVAGGGQSGAGKGDDMAGPRDP